MAERAGPGDALAEQGPVAERACSVAWAICGREGGARDGGVAGLSGGLARCVDTGGELDLWIDSYQGPRNVLPEDDNLLLRFQACRDGIASAPGIEDRRFISYPVVHEERRLGG